MQKQVISLKRILLTRYTRIVLSDPAPDILQEVFLQGLHHLGLLERFLPWQLSDYPLQHVVAQDLQVSSHGRHWNTRKNRMEQVMASKL